ncbi:MAG TPA: hypothetical protein VGM90_30985 [Kofleriaceae bacterium]|jgi:predicted SprT family Zn-dependent metalloprotease
MSSASTVNAPSTRSHPADKFSWERSVKGDVTMLSMHGTLNEEFEAKKLAEAVKTKNVVVAMADVRRIASFGMAEWMDFLRRMSDRDVYLVECSTYAVSQLNLVSGLLGQAKLVSFYSSYRCSGCNTASNSLFLIPRDRQIIRDLPGSEYQCSNCGGASRLEEYPAAFFDTISNRDAFEIDDDVLTFFRNQLKYDLTPDLARFRAVGTQLEDISYMRLSGQLARLPSDKLAHAARARTIMDLEGVAFDDAGVSAWEECMSTILPKVKQLQLHGCPAGFLEAAVSVADLRDAVKVRSFTYAYECMRCDAMRPREIDVAANLEDLVMGKLPDSACPTCKSTLIGMPSADLVAVLKALPARDRDPVLEKFFGKARQEAAAKLENLLVVTAKKPMAPASTGRGGLFAVLGLIVVVLGAVGWFAIDAWRNQKQIENKIVMPTVVADAAPAKPTFPRPDWITEDTPSSSYCQDMINRVMCVGVSSYRTNRDEAVGEANDAALDELVNTVALKVPETFFKESIVPTYAAARNAQLGAVHAAEAERTGDAYKNAQKAAAASRRIVTEALRATGSAAVPAQRSDWHWEEYAADGGGPNEQLVFVRYDVALDAVRSLVEHYSVPVSTIGGASLVTAFPGLGWESPDLASGAVVIKPGTKLARSGVKAETVIVAIDDQPVGDALQLSRALEAADKAHTEVHLKIVTPGAPTATLSVKL